jgi:phage shock protein A
MTTTFTVDLDIKAFKGKGAFRSLMSQQRAVVQSVHAEMRQLEAEVADLELPMLLVTVRDAKAAAYVEHMRLRWRVRGRTSGENFERMRTLFRQVPASLHGYLEACNTRVQELNALEAIFRYATAQTGTFIEHGTVKIVGRNSIEARKAA